MIAAVDQPFAALAQALRDLDQDVDDAVRIDRIQALETLTSVVAAAQARETTAFVDSQRAAQRAAGVKAERVGRGIAGQVALARRISPHQASRYVGWAKILTTELPATNAALWAGATSQWRALIVARESVFLSRDHRAQLDAALAPSLAQLGDRQVEREAKKIGYRLDPEGFVSRLRHAENERHVSLRPAPDSMTRLSALLPLTQGVAALAALTRAADSARAAGDPRGKGQVMADTLVERVTGQSTARDVPLTVNLVMTDQSLLGFTDNQDEPATIVADGVAAEVVPAELARRAVADASGETTMLLRRLYASPATGELIAMDRASRFFSPAQREFLMLRDQTCRTPYCGAAIRHADHVHPTDAGGPTSITNGAGRCEACNHAKQAVGWAERLAPDGTLTTTTPTGHRYRSPTPRARTDIVTSPLEITIRHWLHAA